MCSGMSPTGTEGALRRGRFTMRVGDGVGFVSVVALSVGFGSDRLRGFRALTIVISELRLRVARVSSAKRVFVETQLLIRANDV
jgi:hypothetical protein